MAKVEKEFGIKYIASTNIDGKTAFVIRTDDESLPRCYTRNDDYKAVAEKAKGKKVIAVLEYSGGQPWITELEEVK